MNTRTRNRLIAAVAAALPLVAMAVPASAQVRANQNGRALDGNNRVGSDGSNDRSNNVDARGYTGNQVVTGNVTGNRAFRGPLGYRDPNVFTGPVSTQNTDRFVRDSTGAPTRTQPNIDYGQPTGFYTDSRATPLPPGYRPESFSGGFYNTGQSQSTVAVNPYEQKTSQVYDSQGSLLRGGSVVLGEGVDRNNQRQVLTASPLYGVMELNPTLLENNINNSGLSRTDTFRRGGLGLNPADVERMRQELEDAAQEGQENEADQSNATNLAQPLNSSTIDTSLMGERGADAAQPTASGAPANVGTTDRLAGKFDTSQGLNRRLNVEPAKQSKQYAELQQRLKQLQGDEPQSIEEANRDQRLLKKAQEAGGAGQPGDPNADVPANRPRAVLPPTRGPAAPAAPNEPQPADPVAPEAPAPVTPAEPAAPAPAPAPEAARPAPLQIKSLADGVEAKGLRDLLKSAEDQMKAGNFRDAIEKYSSAEQVAQNNPLIRLGRAHAELGATRYSSAEQSLRQAVNADPALLMGQYDLEAFLGRDRLGFLVKDLKQVANSEAASPRPKLLLAYIAYSMPGQEAAAAEYLKEAAERTGRPDPLIDAMRKHWTLPAATQPAAAENAPAEESKPAEPDLNK